jgi:arylsulfatase
VSGPGSQTSGPDRRRLIGSGLAAGALAAAGPGRAAGQRPNIVLIVADDLGFTDLGCFGGEIATPNLDRLARRGLRLSNFHVAPACSPTRAMLLTGIDHHRTGLGTFAETMQDNQRGHPGYEGYLVERAACVAQQLQAAGYFTAMSGKWHLGADRRADPSVRGFDRSFVLVGGASNHFGKRWDGKPGPDMEYREDGRMVAALPDDFYSSDYFTTRLIEFLDPAARRNAPFFAYLAFTAPHYPLQAPAADIARYRGRYDAGWEALRRSRQAGLVREGVWPHDPPESRVDATLEASWRAQTPEEQRIAARKMEIFAAAVDRLDQNVGRLVAELQRTGQYEDTVFFFMSDNGAEASGLDGASRVRDLARALLRSTDTSFEAMGGPRSYVWYGSGWAQAGSSPFLRYKHYPNEGGVRVPAFVSGPGVRPGVGDAFALVIDVPQTFLELAAAPAPDPRTHYAYTGASMAAYLRGAASRVHARPEAGWELWGRKGYRKGRWKAEMIPPPDGSGRWELYDMEADPYELNDLAAQQPGRLADLVTAWDRYARENGVVLPAVPGQ